MDKLLTIKEISELLQIRVSTLYKWVHMELIPHVKVGRAVRFREKDVAAWLEKKKCNGRSERRIELKT